jgi:ADYC domain
VALGFARAVLLVVGLLAAVCHGRAADRIAGFDVDGDILRVRFTSGAVMSGRDLAGATLTFAQVGGAQLKVKVGSVETDPLDPERETLLYHFLTIDAKTGEARELCDPDARGERWAFPLKGRWDAEGQRQWSRSGFTLTCADGAQGKCVRFGYKPWKTLPNGTQLAPYHQACIRLVRADYCGGHGTTRNGMLIDIYDNIGIQAPDPDPTASGLRFEAAWTASGAACVAHTRVPENITLTQLGRLWPRLAGRLGDTACNEASARRWGANVLMFNRSR